MTDKDKLIPILVGRYIMAARLRHQMKKHYDDQADLPRLKSMSTLRPTFFETTTGLSMGLWLSSCTLCLRDGKPATCRTQR